MGYLYGTMAELRPSPDGAMAVLVSPSICSNQHHDHTDMLMQHGPLGNLLHRLEHAKDFCHSNFKSEHATSDLGWGSEAGSDTAPPS